MSGYLGDLSIEQEKALKQLKENIYDVLTDEHDDTLWLQFLRARRFDLKKTENMLRKHLEWRKVYPKKYLLEEHKVSELLAKYIPSYYLGFDKEGSPINVCVCGAFDLKGMVHTFKPRELYMYTAHEFDESVEKAKEYGSKVSRPAESITYIFDFGGSKFTTFWYKPVYDYLISLLKLYEENYPEHLKAAYVIRVPYFFSIMLNVLKSLADDRTMKKIHYFGENGWREELLKHIDADKLPDWLCHPDYMTMRDIPATIPQKYYLTNKNKLKKDDEDVHQVYLRRRSKYEIPISIQETSSTIIWHVECHDGEIKVGMFYENRRSRADHHEESEVIEPVDKAGAHFGPASGSHVSRKTGEYTLVFDNTFSILTGKNVMYTLKVVPPLKSIDEENTVIEDGKFSCKEQCDDVIAKQ